MNRRIGATSTEKGLRIQAALDHTDYPLKKNVSAAQLSEVQITRETFMVNGTTLSPLTPKKLNSLFLRDA